MSDTVISVILVFFGAIGFSVTLEYIYGAVVEWLDDRRNR